MNSEKNSDKKINMPKIESKTDKTDVKAGEKLSQEVKQSNNNGKKGKLKEMFRKFKSQEIASDSTSKGVDKPNNADNSTDKVADNSAKKEKSQSIENPENSNKKEKSSFKEKVNSFGFEFMRTINILLVTLLVLFMTAVGFSAGWLTYEKYGPEIFGGDNDKKETNDSNDNKSEDSAEVSISEDSVVNVVEQSMESVVSIAVSSYTLDKENGVVDNNSNIGSGFIVDEAGLVLTNQHVVADTTADYVVVGPDSEEYEVTDIQRDDVNDIALLKIKVGHESDLKALSLGDSDVLKAGQEVIAIGTPLGEYAGSVTTGVISGLNRSVTTTSGGLFNITQKTFENVIQTDAAVNPGNSGGPLLNSSGEVIGINFATTASADNISFAIPINFVKDRLDEYRKYGKFRHPSLGVSYEPISDYQARFYRNVVAGALVVGLEDGGPADKAGVKKYDIITAIDGESVDSSLRQLVLSHEVGDTVKVSVWRDGEELEFDITLGEAE